MASNILSIGQSALNAAQVGISVTGHNIANAATPGYNRQVIVQGSSLPQNFGVGFLGQGVEISTVKRIYNEYLGAQVQTTQTAKSSLDSYYAEIRQINNMLADPDAGLSPALQNFFSGIQEFSSNPASIPSRQAALSSADILATRLNSMADQLKEVSQGINTQILSSVSSINTSAQQIAQLNDTISRAQRATGQPPNDLLDQRDQAILDLSKEIKVTVIKQSDGGYNVFIGNGQPLVVGEKAFSLTNMVSPTNPEKIEVAYQTNTGGLVIVGESSLAGGRLGGLIEFRSKTLEPAQNALGQIAIGLASSLNAQHQLGVDLNGAAGSALFSLAPPVVNANGNNTGNAVISASIGNANALTTSDYKLDYDGTNYRLTRLSDNTATTFASFPQTVDGVDLNLASGTALAGDNFLIRPTVNGASGFGVAITDPRQLAAAAPVLAASTAANTGSGTISAGAVNASYLASPLAAPLTLTYNSGTNQLSGFPATQPVTVTSGGTSTIFAAGTPVTYTAGATVSFGGISFTLGGAPANADSFTISPNTSGVGDNRNALLMGSLQTAKTLGNGSSDFQSTFSQLVSQIGNKTRELEVTSRATGRLLTETKSALQNESGVNLDEEATSLLRYQQAYQAAAKVMQIASEMFDMLLSLGR